MPGTAKIARMDQRTTAEVKRAIARAAARIGVSESDFVVQSAYDRALDVLERERRTHVGPADWRDIVAALDRTPRRIPALAKLLAEHRRRVRRAA